MRILGFLMLLFLSGLWIPEAVAVRTSYCPDYLTVSVSDLYPKPRTELSSEFRAYAQKNKDTYDTYEFMLFVNSVRQRLKLVSTRNAQCYYSKVGGYTEDGSFLSAILRGTHSDPVLQVFASIPFEWESQNTTGRSMLSYLAFAGVKKYTRTGMTLDFDSEGVLPAAVYTSYEDCATGSCETKYEFLGTGYVESN